MTGTKAGGLKARDKNLANDPLHYAKIGAKGGRNGATGGFASEKVGKDGLTGKQRAMAAGAKGGRISRRTSPAPQPVEVEKVAA
jgi:general stress protein YciG